METVAAAANPADGQITQDMIRAAGNLFLAIAYESLTRERVNAYKSEILRTHGFEMAPKYAQGKSLTDRLILEPDFAWLMSDEDFLEYQRHCDLARRQVGLPVQRPGGCPGLEADTMLLAAKQAMVDVMKPRTSLDWDHLTAHPGLLDEFLLLTQRLLAKYVDQASILQRVMQGEVPENHGGAQ